MGDCPKCGAKQKGGHPAYPSVTAKWTTGSINNNEVVVHFRKGLRIDLNGQSLRFFPAEVKTLPLDIVHGLLQYDSEILKITNPAHQAYYLNVYLPGLK
jgi:hypothetical protein